MNKAMIALAVIGALSVILTTTVATTSNVFAYGNHHGHHHHSHHHKGHHDSHHHGNDNGHRNSNSQSLSQTNTCGSNSECSNIGSQIQGDGNAVSIVSNQ